MVELRKYPSTCADCWWWFWRDDHYARAVHEEWQVAFCVIREPVSGCVQSFPALEIAAPMPNEWKAYLARRPQLLLRRRDEYYSLDESRYPHDGEGKHLCWCGSHTRT